jgi:hypothetical protein
MTTPPFTHFVFVDFENVPKVNLAAVQGKPVHVALLIGKNQKKLETAFSLQMHQYASQITPIEVGASGRNALDITLACYLGQEIQRTPDAEFFIVSKDKDYDPMLSHLKASGMKVSRHDAFAALPFLKPVKKSGSTKPPFQVKVEAAANAGTPIKQAAPPANKKTADAYAKLLDQIRNGKHRPGTRAKLMHHIHTVYGQKSTEEQQTAVVNRLINDRIVSIDAQDKVTYPSGPGLNR